MEVPIASLQEDFLSVIPTLLSVNVCCFRFNEVVIFRLDLRRSVFELQHEYRLS
jgi:hypothetical protein